MNSIQNNKLTKHHTGMLKTHTHKIFLLICGLIVSAAAYASDIKNIEVAQGQSYTDHLSLKDDSKDMDLMVKFIFDENANTLTVSLISYRKLFVFRDDAKYSQVVKCKKLKPDNLPYVVTYTPKSKYRLTKNFRKAVPKPRKKYVFHRWAECEGLQAVPEEYKMVNDYIEQKYNIVNQDTLVKVTIRDIAVMDLVSKPGKKEKYDLILLSDIDKTYNINIRRNPCFGKEEDIQSSAQQLQSITAAYESFDKQYAHNVLKSAEEVKIFNQIKGLLVTQYPPITDVSKCEEIQQNRDAYNTLSRKIASMRYISANAAAQKRGVDADYLLAQAHIIDTNVSSWILTDDVAMRNDLKSKCEGIIKEVNNQVKAYGTKNKAQANALSIFRKAESYFNRTCKK